MSSVHSPMAMSPIDTLCSWFRLIQARCQKVRLHDEPHGNAAVLDLALAEILSKRLNDLPAECEEFLRFDGDGRAPAGSFGARIQLGLLIGIVTPEDVEVLRAVKQLRSCA